MSQIKSKYRSHTCGELTAELVGATVSLSGWVMRIRDHGGIIFVDLRDNYGITQAIFSGDLVPKISEVRAESVISLTGEVVKRAPNMINPKLPTGEIEISVKSFSVLSAAEVLPFQIAEDDNAPEATRLTYRFLDLRRENVHRNILLRGQVIKAIREIMHDAGFYEFQTPILTSSSPEGARDYLVPSRIHPGKFFALPQAPQQFKQLLMVSGFDRYFQIAPCFRDEDSRADRSPGEFYQLDMEMSFVEQEDVFRIGEQIFNKLFTRFAGDAKVTGVPFPRIPYDQAMSDYGTDKPDLRNPLKIASLKDIFENTGFQVFKKVISSGGDVFGIPLMLPSVPPRKYFDDTVEFFTKLTGQGVAYLISENGSWKGSISKFMMEDEYKNLAAKLSLPPNAVVFLAAGDKKILQAVGRLRTKLAEDFSLIESNAFRFCWITDFPMYEKDEETGEVVFSHNPFSMPQGGIEALKTKDPLTIKAFQYDIVCNGYELSSGAIRNHSPEIMYEAFKVAGYGPDEVERRFGGMLRAFKFGAPPHGGMAPGIDRIVMLLAGESAIRDVIAFPLAQTVEDLMMGAPGEVSEKQLKEAHIKIVMPPKKEN